MRFPEFVYVIAAILFIVCALVWLWLNAIH